MPIGEGWEVPPEAEPPMDFQWFKVSTRRPLSVVILSEEPLWYAGHYVQNRMWPCLGKDCELCRDGIGAQLRYVFAVAEISAGKVGLLEVSRVIATTLREWISRRGQLKGMTVEFQKHSLSRQSRTEVSFVDGPAPQWLSSKHVPDIRRALLLTWRKGEMPIPPALLNAKSELNL